jgi:hypothetical protein
MQGKFLASVVATVALALGLATSGGAQPEQSGLVNINVSDNTVQVPIGIAANVCGVDVIAIASGIAAGDDVVCTALASSEATVTESDGGGAATQEGLINVNIQGNDVQVPIAAAANICGVDVFVLVSNALLLDDTDCDARANSQGNAP